MRTQRWAHGWEGGAMRSDFPVAMAALLFCVRTVCGASLGWTEIRSLLRWWTDGHCGQAGTRLARCGVACNGSCVTSRQGLRILPRETNFSFLFIHTYSRTAHLCMQTMYGGESDVCRWEIVAQRTVHNGATHSPWLGPVRPVVWSGENVPTQPHSTPNQPAFTT